MPSGFIDPSTIHAPAPDTVPPVTWGRVVNHDLRFLGDPPSASVSGGTQAATSGIDLIMVASSVNYDSGGLWSSSAPERLTVPQPGLYLALAAVEVDAFGTTNGQRVVTDFIVGAATVTPGDVRVAQPNPTTTRISIARVLSLEAGDFVRVRSSHNAGGTKSARLSEFALIWKRRPVL